MIQIVQTILLGLLLGFSLRNLEKRQDTPALLVVIAVAAAIGLTVIDAVTP